MTTVSVNEILCHNKKINVGLHETPCCYKDPEVGSQASHPVFRVEGGLPLGWVHRYILLG